MKIPKFYTFSKIEITNKLKFHGFSISVDIHLVRWVQYCTVGSKIHETRCKQKCILIQVMGTLLRYMSFTAV